MTNFNGETVAVEENFTVQENTSRMVELVWETEKNEVGTGLISVQSQDEKDEITVTILDRYTLTVYGKGEGTVEIEGEEVELPFTGYYVEGTEIKLKAISDDRWDFYEWGGDVDDEHKQRTEIEITMEDDIEINPNSEEKTSLLNYWWMVALVFVILVILGFCIYKWVDFKRIYRRGSTKESNEEISGKNQFF